MKFCQDCKYPTRNALGDVVDASMCEHPKSILVDQSLVTGVRKGRQRSCSEFRYLVRAGISPDECGPEANLFEPRE